MVEVAAKAQAATVSTRRGPKARPIQTAAGAINIWATVWAVVIQAPSSKPTCSAPRMSARPKVDSRPVRVEMKAPSRTASSPSHGVRAGGAGQAPDAAAAGAITGPVIALL